MICLNVLEHADPKHGGIATSVPALSRALDAHGRYAGRNAAFCDPGERASAAFVRFPSGRLEWLNSRPSRCCFESLVSDADLVHVHGIWSHHATAACHAARRHGTPYIVSAHGMLEPWALGSKRWKKRVYSALVERGNLRHAACLRALTRQEVLDYRRYGVRVRAAVVPNGIDRPAEISPAPLLERFPALRGRRLTLFLGRLHYKKGLDILCSAWASAPRRPEDHLVIAGADFEGTQASLERMIADLGITASVSFTGLLDSDLKWSALAAAHVFVLPSRSEGFSMAVLEALAAGVPVIATGAANPPDIEKHQCGWVVRPEVASVASALAEALDAGSADRIRWGSNGRRLIDERFTWKMVASQMASVYDWVLGGARPTHVEIFE